MGGLVGNHRKVGDHRPQRATPPTTGQHGEPNRVSNEHVALSVS